jgi:hypothetical protein
LLQVFFMHHLPQAPENNIRVISNFFKNSRRYLKAKVHHRYHRHRRQICHRCQQQRRQILPPVHEKNQKSKISWHCPFNQDFLEKHLEYCSYVDNGCTFLPCLVLSVPFIMINEGTLHGEPYTDPDSTYSILLIFEEKHSVRTIF